MKKYLFASLFFPVFSWAQTNNDIATESPIAKHCEIVYLPDEVFTQTSSGLINPLGEPSHFPSSNDAKLIPDTEYEYVYRLAICISPDYINTTFKGDKSLAQAWVKEAGEYLNTVYPRDLGIRFEIIENDRLLLTEFPQPAFEDSYGTQIIDELIGNQNYDCGILIRPSTATLSGRASLGGIYSSRHKGSAMANLEFATIAHEIGHLYGSKHTHQKDDALCIEPGNGQSIMSYGEPCTFFSLASIIAIRNRLKNQCYYLGPDRNPNEIGGGTPGENANIPYVIQNPNRLPKLDRSTLRKNYTVTEGTRFQFYIPVENASDSFTYGAQGYDASVYGYEGNALQPIYSLSAYPCTMFQPYYNEGNNREGKKDAILVKHSDAFRPGRYQFLLAAADNSRYDVEPVILNIVKGKKFEMKSTLKMDQYQGKQLNLSWEPCTELYGKDSQVRILLSDDFGQTYKYVLDDNVPNTGTWSGYWPFIEIGRTSYRNFSEQIRGGVIKIEIKNEAAYCVSKELPAFTNPNIVYQGGFLLSDNSTYVRFKNGPAPYLVVDSEDDVPPMEKLEAYHKNMGKNTMVEGEEERKGNIIRRRWTASINQTSSTYTQLIVINDNTNKEHKEVAFRADELKLMAVDLHRNSGKLGYPLNSLAESREFATAYAKVFDEEGNLQPNVTKEQVEQLRNTMTALTAIKDNEIAKPANRHYYTLRNFQDIYGRYAYYYMSQPEEIQNGFFTSDSTQATLWRCLEKDGRYTFMAANGRKMHLEPIVTPDYRETLALDRGYTWGAFTLVEETNACAQLSQQARHFTKNEMYINDPEGYRINRNSTVSTDFQFLPIQSIEARTEPDAYPWNILENTNRLTLSDDYRDLYVGEPIEIKELVYTRTFNDNGWQALYLPFATHTNDWAANQCEIARIDNVKFMDTNGDGKTDNALAEWVLASEENLQANQPYLIRAKETGKYSFTFNNATILPTEENSIELKAEGCTAVLKGNYGTIPADIMMQHNGYVLQNNVLRKTTAQSDELHSMRWLLQTETADSKEQLPENITLIEKSEAPIGIISITTPEGYGTIFTETDYIMPEGVTGYAITGADTDSGLLTLTEAYTEGENVPASTALLVKGQKRDYPLYAAGNDAPANRQQRTEGNLLMGTATATTTTAPDGQDTSQYCFYKLGYQAATAYTAEGRIGFYWAEEAGTPFINEANQAYLVLSKQQADGVGGFALIPEDPTGIEAPNNPEYNTPETIYTITGVRLHATSKSDLPPGFYIINGKKEFIR